LAYNPESPDKCKNTCNNVNNTVLRWGRGFIKQDLNGIYDVQNWLLTQGSVVARMTVGYAGLGAGQCTME
jgi:hypothetical protein